MKDSKHRDSKVTRTRDGKPVEWYGWHVAQEFDTMDEYREEYIADGLTAEEADEEIARSFKEGWWRWKDGKIQVAAEGPYTTEEEW